MLIFTYTGKGVRKMNKDFNDFYKVLDTKEIAKLAKTTAERCMEASETFSKEEVIAISVSVASRLSVETLRQYHEWLLEQNDE